MATKSQYAQLFGSAPAWLGLGRNQSGVTPLGPPDVEYRPLGKAVPQQVRDDVEEYQKELMRGFTTQMLVDIDSITHRQLKPIDLTIALPELFWRTRWVRPPQNFLNSLPPNYVPTLSEPWSAHMDSVWGALLPCLRIAAQILEHIYKHPWV